ncbi:MAG: FRG domain-containing protein [Gemmatimonadetes bacterium]|nr:FRG domain-containing protein [Gemmatimonadota bacterium]
MAVEEIRVETLGDLVDRVTPSEPDPETGKRRYSGVYHGSLDAGTRLLTSLDRLGGMHQPHSKVALEEHIFRNFIRYSRPYVAAAPVSEWELLVTAQHHRVPTRLLDWTYSPLVAAHFATRATRETGDRVIWRLDWRLVHRHFGFPELALLIQDLQDLHDDFTPWKLFRGEHDRDFACMIDPPSVSPRIIAQTAVFTLITDNRVSFDEFLGRHGLESALKRYLIPGHAVDRFRDQLDLVGMDERRLFPDLDGVAAQMRRYYS